jgi:hypothetical protein
MRFTWAAISLICSLAYAAAQQMAQAPPADVELPYWACGDMAALRNNLTGAPDPTPMSDAILRRLGVHCIGPAAAPRIRQRY